MAYQKYLHEGVILKMEEWGESGRILKILTDQGIRSLVATGVRELGSKMRGGIDVLSKVEFEYVEGKEVGRLVGIFPKEKLLNIQDKFVRENILKIRNSISNVVNFLIRVVVGETENEKLYVSFLEGLDRLQRGVGNAPAPLETLEVVWLIKILVSLGYWEEGKYDDFKETNLKFVSENKKNIVESINKSIESSHM
jgi:recombinational DNA repair protein (RecF pathway)